MASAFFLLVALLSFSGYASSEVHNVGNGVGWTLWSGMNYTDWASSKNFHVGDTIVFEYSTNYHSLLEVNRADYRSCNAASPIVTYTTGNDSIPMRRAGHRFFICGVPGHCAAGMRVHIRTLKFQRPTNSPSVSPLKSPSSSGPTDSGSSFVSPAESQPSVAPPASCFDQPPPFAIPPIAIPTFMLPLPPRRPQFPSTAASEGLSNPLAIFVVAVAAYYSL